jgi:peptidyl-prolyl cis-trans isomerase C
MSVRLSALLRASALCLVVGGPVSAWAQTGHPPPTPAQPPAPAQPGAPGGDPVVARVGDQTIRLSDVETAAQSLPPNVRQMPPQILYPMLLDRLIDQEALAEQARKIGLEKKDPAVAREVKLAETLALGSAMLAQEVRPQVTEQAVRAQYEKEYAGKPGPEEVHAKHILVDSEAQAKDIIAQLKKGANWDELAKKYSKDQAAANGGDLGFFKKDQMVPAFADEAFKLQPGQVSPEPVHTQFGWHVIKVIARRQEPPPSFDQVKNEIRQQLVQQAAQKAVAQALSQVKVEKFNPDGSPMQASNSPAPPASPAPAK